MTKKVGIITYHNGRNYGAFLQVYALQKLLKQKNYKVEVINYKSLKMILKEFRAIFTKKPRETYLNLLNFFSYFVYRKQLNLTTFTINKKKALKKKFDFIVFGSDEIWNFESEIVGFNEFYFGKYTKIKKYGFSVSFGTVKGNEKKLSIVEKYLKKFKKISIRDIHSSKILDNLKIKNKITLDPVFLYDFEKELSNLDFKIQHKKYILIYGTIYDNSIIKNIQKFAKEKKIKIISICYFNKWADENIIYSWEPFSFLEIFKKSTFIFTSMFHGVVLSLKFEKEFFILKDSYRENKLSHLSENLNFKFIDANKKYNINDFMIQSNYPNLNRTKFLSKNIKKSLKFLKNNFV